MLRNFHIALLLLCSSLAYSQVPFAGYILETIPISPAALTEIQATGMASPVCYRIKIQFSEPGWQLITLYTDDQSLPFLASSTTSFFQSPAGGPLSSDINPAFYPPFPSLEYDSWLTIKYEYDLPSNGLTYVPGSLFTLFETGGPLYMDQAIGGSVFVVPTNVAQTTPEPDNTMLIAQLTTDGDITWQASMLFRIVVPDGTPIDQITLSEVDACFEVISGVGNPCPLIILPVSVTHFAAVAEEDRVKLEWITESEENNDYFVVERTFDGEKFEEVARMDGQGSTISTTKYVSQDWKPVRGINYYRLVQYDFNGERSESELVSVFWEGSGELIIYPNPATEIVNINGQMSDYSSAQLVAADGQVVWSVDRQVVASLTQIDLRILNVSSGIYSLVFERMDGTFVTERICVQ